MSTNKSTQTTTPKQLTKHLRELLTVLGSAVGASGLGVTMIYAMGFVVVNTSLQRQGAYELSLLRTEFLVAGISFLVLTLGMILLGAVAVDPLIEGVENKLRGSYRPLSFFVIFTSSALLLGVMYLVTTRIPAGAQCWDRLGTAVIWVYQLILIGSVVIERLVTGVEDGLARITRVSRDWHRPLSFILIFITGVLLLGVVYLASTRHPLGMEWWDRHIWAVILGYPVVLSGSVVVDRLVRWLEAQLPQRGTSDKNVSGLYRPSSILFILIAGIYLLWVASSVIRLFPVGVQWWDSFGRAAFWGYMVALVGGIYAEYVIPEGFWKKLTAPAPELPEIGKVIFGGISLLLLALVTYGHFAYPHLPRSWGGGSPIYAEFVVEEEAIPMLEVLGLKVGEGGLTERVEILTECPERIFVLTQRGDTLSFDPSLVKASKFYNIDYYVSAELHLSKGEGYRGQRQWSNAIREYNAALLIQADLLDARIGRGMAHTEKYVESVQKESPDQNAYLSADGDLTEATMDAEEKGEKHREALAYYQRGRLRFYHAQHQDEAPQDVADAIGLDSSFLREAMLEEAFRESSLPDDDTLLDDAFRRAMHESDQGLAEEYDRLGRELKDGGEVEQAVALYDLAASIAEDLVKDGEEVAARYRAHKGDALEILPDVKEAINEYERAVELDPDVTHYRYRLALLSYEYGLPDPANVCQEPIEQATEDVATIGCLIVRGNVRRDSEEWEDADAIADYTAAVSEAMELGAPSFTASAFYDWARLEARRENTEQAILLLERAVWLDRAHSERAQLESDFDILRELADYQRAISPPIVVEIGSDTEEGIVSFFLLEPADDFPERLTVLTQILRLADLLKPDGTGQAESFDVSEDGLLYTFHLKEDAAYSADELASALRKLLGLAE